MARRLLPLLALLALVGITCAPQDDTPRKPGAVVQPPPVAIEPAISQPLKARVEAALEDVHSRDLRPDNGFWTIFHGFLGMGPAPTLYDPATKQRLNALDEI